jgi:hypothetical protein
MFPTIVLKEVRYTCISTSCGPNQMKMHPPLVIKRVLHKHIFFFRLWLSDIRTFVEIEFLSCLFRISNKAFLILNSDTLSSDFYFQGGLGP